VPAVPNPLADGFEVPDVPPLEEMQKTAADVRPDVQAALALVTAAHRGLGAAIAEYFPSFSVDFDRWLTRQSFPPDSRWLFGASANIPIFTGGKTYADVRTAYSLVRQARQYESLTRRQAAEEVAVAWNNFEASDRLIREYETEVAAASDASALADQSYDVGLVTNLDRLVVQDRLLQAQLQLAAERLNRKILYFRLAEAVGELVDRVAGRTASPPPPAGPQAQAEKSPAFRLTAETPETKGKDSSR
jgi:outer membrane protein TolC